MDANDRQIVESSVRESKDPFRRKVLVILAVALAACIVIAAAASLYIYDALNQQAEDGLSLAEEVQTACADPDVDTAELGGLCNSADDVVESKPEFVEGPQGPEGPAGKQGQQGIQGPPPSAAQVANAVSLYCSSGRCDGDNATESQVRTAVASYCNDRGECRGPAGADGRAGSDGGPGQPGADGADGEPGPGPSASQVEAAVQAYCSTRNGCRGPQGEVGETGPAGPEGQRGPVGEPGRGITSIACSGLPPQSFTITYSDGTVETIECSPST